MHPYAKQPGTKVACCKSNTAILGEKTLMHFLYWNLVSRVTLAESKYLCYLPLAYLPLFNVKLVVVSITTQTAGEKKILTFHAQSTLCCLKIMVVISQTLWKGDVGSLISGGGSSVQRGVPPL